jgi:hypothetical protein
MLMECHLYALGIEWKARSAVGFCGKPDLKREPGRQSKMEWTPMLNWRQRPNSKQLLSYAIR